MSWFSDPSPTVTSKVKSPVLQRGSNALIGDAGALRTSGQQTLDDYINQYLKQTKNAESNTAQEQSSLDQFYNGGMAQQLAALRNSRATAANAAADSAVAEALHGVKSSAVGGQGTGSSYEDRLAMGAVLPIRTNVALQNADLARGDLNYLTQNQIGLAGQRTAMGDALAGRALVPYGVQAGMLGQNLGFQGQLLNQDQLNHFYGLHQDPSTIGGWTNALNQTSGLINAGSGVIGAGARFGSNFMGIPGISSLGGLMGAGSGVGSAGWDPAGEMHLRYGGLVRGGMVHGPGSYTSDSVPAHLSRDEFVIPAAAVHIPGVLPVLQRIRQMGLALTPGLGVHPGHLAGGGFYADSFGGLTRADQSQQALDLQRYAQTDRSLSDDEQRAIQQKQFEQTLAETHARDQNQQLYQRGQLDLQRQYLAQGGTQGTKNAMEVAATTGEDTTGGKDPNVAAAAKARQNELTQQHQKDVSDATILNKVETAKQIKAAADAALQQTEPNWYERPTWWVKSLFTSVPKDVKSANATLAQQKADAEATLDKFGPIAAQIHAENIKSGRLTPDAHRGYVPSYTPPFLQSQTSTGTNALSGGVLPRTGSGFGDLQRGQPNLPQTRMATVRIQTSDGKIYRLPSEKLHDAQALDPGLQVLAQ